MHYIRFASNDKNATCSCVPTGLPFLEIEDLRIAQVFLKLSFLSICRHCAPFLQDFGQA